MWSDHDDQSILIAGNLVKSKKSGANIAEQC